jgi:deoxyribonuclease V
MIAVEFPSVENISPREAIALQKTLAKKIVRKNQFGEIVTVAGVDVGFEQNGAIARAAIAVVSVPDLRLIDQAIARRPTEFPYIPGLLSFREIPVILDAFKKLKTEPDLLLVDGQGIAHPRRLGIASHLGLVLDKPSIGVGKTRLVGKHDTVPRHKGEWTPLVHKDEIIGAVLRTRENIKPIYISSGHRIDLETSVDWVMRCVTRYKLPETTRWAHKLASG